MYNQFSWTKEEFKGSTVMKGVLTGSRYAVLSPWLYTPLKKGFLSNTRTKFQEFILYVQI